MSVSLFCRLDLPTRSVVLTGRQLARALHPSCLLRKCAAPEQVDQGHPCSSTGAMELLSQKCVSRTKHKIELKQTCKFLSTQIIELYKCRFKNSK